MIHEVERIEVTLPATSVWLDTIEELKGISKTLKKPMLKPKILWCSEEVHGQNKANLIFIVTKDAYFIYDPRIKRGENSE